jgi:hypothetical protein
MNKYTIVNRSPTIEEYQRLRQPVGQMFQYSSNHEKTKCDFSYLSFFIIGTFIISLFACSLLPKPKSAHLTIPTSSTTQTINSVETVINDMLLPHEGKPHGVPESYNWALVPRIGMGNDPQFFHAMTAWGHMYEDSAGNPAKNTRVQIRNIRAYMLSKADGQWHLIQSSPLVKGAAYRVDFAYNINVPADVRPEADGGVSAKAGGDYNFHFWPSTGRIAINPEDIAGIFVTVQARLVVDEPAQADDRAQARYLLGVGGDYWLSQNAVWFFRKTNKDIAIGRFKYVTTVWQAFNMTTLSANELQHNPPPIE